MNAFASPTSARLFVATVGDLNGAGSVTATGSAGAATSVTMLRAARIRVRANLNVTGGATASGTLILPGVGSVVLNAGVTEWTLNLAAGQRVTLVASTSVSDSLSVPIFGGTTRDRAAGSVAVDVFLYEPEVGVYRPDGDVYVDSAVFDDPAYDPNATDCLVSDSSVLSGLTATPSFTGVCADGSSRLVLAYRLIGAPARGGTVRATVQGSTGAPSDCRIALPGSAWSSTGVVTATLVPAPLYTPGEVCYFVLRGPDDFVRPGVGSDETSSQRSITVTLEHTLPGASQPDVSIAQSVDVHRAPLVLCHGLWGAAETWQDESGSMAGFGRLGSGTSSTHPFPLVRKIDYSQIGSAQAAFARYHAFLGSEMQMLLARVREFGIAATRVDWVGHSMGGVLPRSLYRGRIDSGRWARRGNFGQGDVHRTVLLGSPQHGSPWANFIWGNRADDLIEDLVVLAAGGHSVSAVGEAVRDLRVGSDAIRNLGPYGVPTHSVTAVGMENIPGFVLGNILQWGITLLTSNATRSCVYGNERHDGVVLESSQLATLPSNGACVSVFNDNSKAFHAGQTRVDALHDLVLNALNSPRGTAFCSLAAPANQDPPPCLDDPNLSLSLLGRVVVRVIAPAPESGTLIAVAGQSVQLGLDPAPGFTPAESVLLIGDEAIVVNGSAPVWIFNAPDGVVGTFPVRVVTRSASDERRVSDAFELTIQSPSALTGVEFEGPGPVFSSLDDTRQLLFRGRYADGVTRLIAAGSGAVFSSSDTSVVNVTAEGEVRSIGDGSATITGSFGGFTANVVVEVDLDRTSMYGLGVRGSGGAIPYLTPPSSRQQPNVGNSNYSVEVRNGLGGAAGAMFMNVAWNAGLRVFDLPIYPDLVGFWQVPISLGGNPGTAGDGDAVIPLSISSDPGLSGLDFHAQCFFLDPNSVAQIPLTATNGLLIRVR